MNANDHPQRSRHDRHLDSESGCAKGKRNPTKR
jgi:hypothetical protein